MFIYDDNYTTIDQHVIRLNPSTLLYPTAMYSDLKNIHAIEDLLFISNGAVRCSVDSGTFDCTVRYELNIYMKFITRHNSDETETKIFYEDLGTGRPIVLIHGWPLDHSMWDYQVAALTDAGFRCIAYDRRGFGKSNKPLNGYDYDTLTGDLKALIDELQLEDAVLVGFSMGGGEVVKYFANYQGKGVTKAVLISSIAPFMLQTENNPEGVPQENIDEIAKNIQADRPGFLGTFGKQFYGVGLLSNPVSSERLTYDLICAMQATLKSTLGCAASFSSTDLRPFMSHINVPTLVIHGDDDQTVPIAATGQQAAEMIIDAEFIVYEGEPHGLFITAKDRLNQDLIEFIGR